MSKIKTPARIASNKKSRTKGKALERELARELDVLTIARRIRYDSKKADKTRGHEFDLDIDFIIDEIQKGCSYCGIGHKDIRITLDRVDNSLGHIKSNIIPSCIRCNLVRGNMPFNAWLIVANSMRNARLLGLFENWIPGAKTK